MIRTSGNITAILVWLLIGFGTSFGSAFVDTGHDRVWLSALNEDGLLDACGGDDSDEASGPSDSAECKPVEEPLPQQHQLPAKAEVQRRG